MQQSDANRRSARSKTIAADDEDAIREHRFWIGLMYVALAAYAAVIVSVFGYALLTWGQANRGWLVVLAACAVLSTTLIFGFRHSLVAPRWRLAFFPAWNTVSFLYAILLCLADGGVASPLTSFYILPMLFLAIGYPLRVALGCGAAGLIGFAVLVALSPTPLPGFALSIQAIALVVGYLMAIMGATNRDRQSRDLLALRNQLEHMASTDALSGCMNQRAFNAALAAEIERAARFRRPVALLLIDVDHFKAVNDRHGHLMGDELLRQVGAAIRASARNMDFCGRIGGDEFALLAPETAQVDAIVLAERLLRHMRDHPTSIQITLSIGICALTPDMEQVATLFRRADQALYEAKYRGRDRVVGYDDVAGDPRPAADSPDDTPPAQSSTSAAG